MNTSQPVRILTFSVFLAFIAGFVAYRAGAFESESGSPEPLIEEAMMAVDTPGVKTDSLKVFELNEEMMSSSKSMVIYTPPKQDTAKKKQDSISRHIMMTSSKSGGIFLPKDLKIDTSRQEKTDAGNQQKKPMMGGSKSAYIYDPSDFEPKKDTAKPKKK